MPNAYLQTKVMTASPAELRLMLLDGAIKFTEQAREGMEANDYETSYLSLTRAQNILLELINSLQPNHSPELCEQLSALYTFMYTHLVKASIQRDVGLIDEVLRLLRYERETWEMLMDELVESHNTPTQAELANPSAESNENPKIADLVGGSVSVHG